MMRLLVIEGNSKQSRERRVAWGGHTPAEGYGKVLNGIEKNTSIDIVTPADEGFNSPSIEDLSGYDGIALTGSSMHLYENHPEITRQINLAKLALQSGTPIFGSCWGIQVLSAAEGAEVRKNPKGREVPVARKIRVNGNGINHPLFDGKPDLFDAPAIHLDEVASLPANATLLASNDVSEVQAYELKTKTTTAWGVQYHPEYSLFDLASITDAIKPLLMNEAFFANENDFNTYVQDLHELHKNPNHPHLKWKYGFCSALLEKNLREKELENWLKHLVKPTKSKRGRA